MAFLQMLSLYKLLMQVQNASKSLRKTASGMSVVPGSLDPYLNACVAPSYALEVLNINLFEIFFELPPNEHARMKADVQICDALASNRPPKHKALYNVSSGEVHAMTISGTFPTLFMLYAFSNPFPSQIESTSAVEISLRACTSYRLFGAGVLQ